MGIYPKRKDAIQKRLEQQDLINFASKGGTPKGAPLCYGTLNAEKTARQTRSCNSCDETLRIMCQTYEKFLKQILSEREKEYEIMKDVIEEEYSLKGTGQITNIKLQRKKWRRS